ncbi:MAG: DUF2608 domain-containing protein [Roseivirga sp.]
MTKADSMGAVREIVIEGVKQPATGLVAFDVDMTLTVPKHPACHYPTLEQHRNVLKEILAPLSIQEHDQVMTLAVQKHGQQLADPDTLPTLEALQQQGLKTMALTASLSGNLVGIGNLQERRFQDLYDLGIDFRTAFAQPEILLEEIPVHNDHHPIYHQGVLYANGGRTRSNKGAVLVAFLKRVGWKPQHVVMIDDKIDFLNDVAQALPTLDPTIQFTGIEYHGAQTHTTETITEEAFVAYWQACVEEVQTGSIG